MDNVTEFIEETSQDSKLNEMFSMCRLCGKTDEPMKNIFEDRLNADSYDQKIFECTSVKVIQLNCIKT